MRIRSEIGNGHSAAARELQVELLEELGTKTLFCKSEGYVQ